MSELHVFGHYCLRGNDRFKKAMIDCLLLAYVEHVQAEIELRKMRYFLAIAEERSFTRAAKRCHVAQSSLSRQIRSMEVSLEARLFDRLPREIRLTDAGRVLEKEANKVLEHSRRAVSLVQALKREKDQKLRVGLSTVCDLPRIRALVETSRKSVAQIAVECRTAYTPELLLALHRGSLDIAVVDLPIKSHGIGLRPVYSEPLIAVLPRSHALAQRPMVRVFELKNEQLTIVSPHLDTGSLGVEAMLRQKSIEGSSLSVAANLIELLDHVVLHRSIGLMRSSAGRLRRDDVLYKSLADPSSLRPRLHGERRIAVLRCCRSGMRSSRLVNDPRMLSWHTLQRRQAG
jgi:DNA-binding transcriptional LysR family regulator